jgi:hypothetical protein
MKKRAMNWQEIEKERMQEERSDQNICLSRLIENGNSARKKNKTCVIA